MSKKKFIVFSLICLLTIAVNLFTSYSFTSRFFESLAARKKELVKVYQYVSYLSHLKDAETGQRGFVITGDPAYLEPYHNALIFLNSQEMQDFFSEELNSSNPFISEKTEQIKKLEKQKLDKLSGIIDIRRKEGFESARRLIQDNSGKKIMDELRILVNSILTAKQEHLVYLDKDIHETMNEAIALLIVSNSIAICLLGASLFSIYKSNRQLEIKESELLLALQKLNTSLATREAILNAANSAIISVNLEGIITSFNPAAEKLLGYSMPEVVGKCSPSIFHDPIEIEARAITLSKQLNKKILPSFDVFILLASEGIPDTNEWSYIRKDGSRFPVLLSVTAIKEKEGRIVGYVGIAYEITERKEAERMKNELIAITTYELRSPIASIKGTLDLLSQPELALSNQAIEILMIGQKNCHRLVRLTEDLLDLQKIEAGKANFIFKPINVANLVSQALQLNSLIPQEFTVPIICQAIPSEWSVEGDEDRLLQVFNNLLSNAIKYSPPGGQVEVLVNKVDSKIQFEIVDRGPGIPEEFQAKVFQRFARDASSANAEKKGTGLGLNIAKSIIEKHKGGVIGFKTSSKGTTFWFELPASDVCVL